jgi:hypothetical protein
MPSLNKQYTLEITPEQFLNACSRNELIETGLLLDSPAIQRKVSDHDDVNVGPRPVLIRHDRSISILAQMTKVFPLNSVQASAIVAEIVELVNLSPSDVLTLMPHFQKLERLRIKSLVQSPQYHVPEWKEEEKSI